MIKELVLPLVDSEAISEKMEAKAKEIVRLIEDPDYVRRNICLSMSMWQLSNILRSNSANLNTALRYEANPLDSLTG